MEIPEKVSLEQLLSGKLLGRKTLSISQNLESFPLEILALADSLEFLDLSTNKLSELPNQFSLLKNLKILFLSQNKFTEFPKVLSLCPNLEIIGFKSNQIKTIAEHSFPKHLRWLILTNNQLSKIPRSIGKCAKMQKLMLAGNQLTNLPVELSLCSNLQLLRISANQFDSFPEWLFKMPRLSWLALAGNPCSFALNEKVQSEIPTIDWKDLECKELLGSGASGYIYKASFLRGLKDSVALKIFKDTITSDGNPKDEMKAAMHAGIHANLIPVLGELTNHPEGRKGLVLQLIPESYKNLGGPPNYETCSRDTFSPDIKFSGKEVQMILKSLASVALHLHEKGIMHGDLYAHNTLIDFETSSILFGDFGAATIYDRNSRIAFCLERLEVRAFGCLVEDLLGCLEINERNSEPFERLLHLKEKCLVEKIEERPSFAELKELLT